MEIGDWVLVGAVLVSLFIGIWNILSIRNIEHKKYEYELLKEIVDWLESVMRCGGQITLRFMSTPQITPKIEKNILHQAVAEYLIIASKIEYISKIASLAGISISDFSRISRGILDVMKAIDKQLTNDEINFATLYENHIRPLNEDCSDIMKKLGEVMGRSLKRKRDTTSTENNESENSDNPDDN